MLSDNIRNYRKTNNMSQDELAEKLDVSRQSISLWENGQTQPTIENIIALAKIFNISADELLDGALAAKPAQPKDKNKKKTLIIILISVIAAAVLIIGALLAIKFFGKSKDKTRADAQKTVASVTEPAEEQPKTTAETSSPVSNSKSSNKKASSGSAKKNVIQLPETIIVDEVDLFALCKDFAIKNGHLNGDYCIYQQPSAKYGGYENEYFSVSYWGDSNMVEFALHCPLDDTYSINFYLRMRGGYSGQYEYLSSRYYRDNGESVRSAAGYIDPNVFSDKYPLSCSEYKGTTDKQNDFMEESRVGICDLIHCLKKFTEVENLGCDFDSFEFANF